MRIRPILMARMTAAVCALSLASCSGEAVPLPEVRYFAIADI